MANIGIGIRLMCSTAVIWIEKKTNFRGNKRIAENSFVTSRENPNYGSPAYTQCKSLGEYTVREK